MNYKVLFNFTEFPDRFFEKTLISETSGQKRQNERYIILVKTLTLLWMSFLGLLLQVGKGNFRELHAAKSVRIRSFFWSIFSLNAGKYETVKTPYLDNLLAVKNIFFTVHLLTQESVLVKTSLESQKFHYLSSLIYAKFII